MLTRNLSRFKLVTFDITETLLKFSKPPAIQYKETAETFGIGSIDEKKALGAFKRCFKDLSRQYPNYGYNTSIDWREWWRRLVVNILTMSSTEKIDPMTLNQIAMTLIDQYETSLCWEKYTKADELVTKMQHVGKCVGVISNFDPRLRYLLKNMNFPEFEFVLTSYEAGVLKPHKDIFDAALRLSKVGVKPEEALHIGNKYEADCKGALDAGWSGVLIKTGFDDSEKKEQADCHIYSNLEEFLYNLENKTIQW